MPAPAGDVCPAGGTVVVAGRDDDGDGVLDDDEIETTDYVCDAPILVRMRAEPAGEHCPDGGIAFLTGRDGDGDGALADAEVESAAYECDDVIARSVDLATAEDVALLAGVREIEGSLNVYAPGDVELPALRHVGKSLLLSWSSTGRLSLPSLETLGGELYVAQSAALTALELPSLEHIGGQVRVFDNAQLASLDLVGLASVDGALKIDANAELASLRFGVLESVAGPFIVQANGKLDKLSLNFGEYLPPLWIMSNPALQTFDLNGFFGFDPNAPPGGVTVRENASLTEVRLRGGAYAKIDVSENAALEKVELVAWHSDGDVLVAGPALRKVHLGSYFFSIDYGVYYSFRGALIIDGPVDSVTSDVFFSSDRLTLGPMTLRNTRAESFYATKGYIFLGDVTFENNDLLRQVVVGAFEGTPVGNLGGGLRLIGNDVLESVDAYADGGVLRGDLVAIGNGALPGFSSAIGNIETVQGSVLVGENPSFSDFSTDLRTVGGDLRLWQLPSLSGLALGALRQVLGQVEMREMGFQGAAGLMNLASASAVAVVDNPALTELWLPALADAGSELRVEGNAALGILHLDTLASAGLLRFLDNPVLPVCAIEAVFDQATGFEQQSGNDDDGICH
jgi:hypothetical protein